MKKIPVSFDNWRETRDAEEGAPVAGYDVYFIDETPKLINQIGAENAPTRPAHLCLASHLKKS